MIWILCQVLLDAGDEWSTEDLHLNTALHMAARGGHVDAVKVLLEAGALRESRNIEGETPLIGARERKHTAVETVLKEAKANVHFRLHW